MLPLVEITLEDSGDKLPVSGSIIRLGRSFKGQLCTVVLFRIIQRNSEVDLISPELWNDIVKIILNLYENLLLSPDIFQDLQASLKIGPLPKPAPEMSITRGHESKGLLSTFASYLKGDEEPTDEEIHYARKAFDCVKSSNISSSIFGNETNITPMLIKSLLEAIKTKKSESNNRYFESELLFLIEISTALIAFCKDEGELGSVVLQKIISLSQLAGSKKGTHRRLLTYKLLLISLLDEQQDNLLSLINDELLTKKDLYNQKYFVSEQGKEIVRRLLALTKIDNYKKLMLEDEGFWKLLRMIASFKENTLMLYEYMETSITTSCNFLTNKNFMWALGLLDEISSIGSIGSRWEQEYNLSLIHI